MGDRRGACTQLPAPARLSARHILCPAVQRAGRRRAPPDRDIGTLRRSYRSALVAGRATDTVYLYDLPSDTFEVHDAGAGYYVSREAVSPQGVTPITDLLAELTRRDVELRVTPSLWPLRDAVAASTLQFSIIRMRNAAPRPNVIRSSSAL